MTAFNEVWSALQNAAAPAPFMLIDSAGIEGGQARLPVHAFAEMESLFTGDLAVELADVGPYLGRLRSYEPDVRAVVQDLLQRQVALLVVLRATEVDGDELPFAQLHRHFRKFNVVYDSAGNPLFFRYYDPRVLVDVLGVFEAKQLGDFFGPVEQFVLLDGTRQTVTCQRQRGLLAVSR